MIKRNLLVIGLAVLLSACGFHLRGTAGSQIPLKELDVSARDAFGQTVTQLRQVLTASEVKLYTGAPYKLYLSNEQEQMRTAAYIGSGRSAEYQLTNTVSWEIHGDKDRLLTQGKVETERFFVHDGNNLIGSDQEAAQLRGEIRTEQVNKLIAQLHRMTPDFLQDLQAKADARAQAEADAEAAAQRVRDETPQQSPVEIPRQEADTEPGNRLRPCP